MKHHIIMLWILTAFIACAGNSNPPATDLSADIGKDTGITDADTIQQEETKTEIRTDTKNDTNMPDEATINDITDIYVPPKTCKDQLTKYQCLKDEDCAKGYVCSGVIPCNAKNCFGNCDVYPGTCVPAYKDAFCTSSKGCPTDAYYTCVGAKACSGSGCLAKTIPGLCRYAGPGQCYTDTDCTGDKYCAQAIYCQTGPCQGQDFAGKCQDKPKKGCLDDRDCEKAMECHDAKLCTMFDSCQSQAGTCAQTEPCNKAQDCSNPKHNFCETAYTCNFDKCIYLPSAGYCVQAPGPASCWTDKDCGKERPLCKGARPCKPGSMCDTTGNARTGYCVAKILPDGLKLSLPGNIVTGQPFPVAIINYSGVTLSVRKTYTFNYQQKKTDGSFIDRCPDDDNENSCFPAGPFIAINDGGVFTRMEKVTSPGTYRVQIDVFSSSVQGFLPKNPNSIGAIYPLFRYESGEFTVRKTP